MEDQVLPSGNSLLLPMTPRLDRWLDRAWWIGFPLFLLFLIWAIHLGWYQSIPHGTSPLGLWRIDVIPSGVFDTYLYLSWMSAVLTHEPVSTPLPWFIWLLRLINDHLSGLLRLPEIWLLSRWITGVAGLWLAGWTVQQWSGLHKQSARLVALIGWLFLAGVLGMRPGFYSWYFPFCVAGWGCAYLSWNALSEKRWYHALLFSVAALILSSLYPWVFISVGIWLAAGWGIWLIKMSSRLFFAISASLSLVFLGGVGGVYAFLHELPTTFWTTLETYQRLGAFLFSRFPILSHTVLSSVGWIILFVCLLQSFTFNQEQQKRFFILGSIWLTCLVLWFQNILSNFYLQNDHFIVPVVLASWMSVGAFVNFSFPNPLRPKIITKLTVSGVALFSSLITCFILLQSLRHLRQLDVYLIHLAHWIALSVCSLLLATSLFLRPKLHRPIFYKGLILSLLLTTAAWVVFYVRALPSVSSTVTRRPQLEWLLARTKTGDHLCSDPETAHFLSAHSGRSVFPAESMVNYPYRDEDLLHRMRVYVGAFDARSPAQAEYLDFLLTYYRTSTCDYGRGQFRRWSLLLKKIGFSPAKTLSVLGCPDARNRAISQTLFAAIQHRHLDAQGFKALCPVVIIPQQQRSSWQLPSHYTNIFDDPTFSVWSSTE